MKKKILVLSGHPTEKSLGESLARAYVEGARERLDTEIEHIALRHLNFDPILHGGYNEGYEQELEDDLKYLQKQIKLSDHLVLVTLLWWGNTPALVKRMVDRVFLPGFAFKYEKGSQYPEQLMKGKTASVILIADTPQWYQNLYRGGLRPLLNSTLRFVGYKIKSVSFLAPVRKSSDIQRSKWLAKIRAKGALAA